MTCPGVSSLLVALYVLAGVVALIAGIPFLVALIDRYWNWIDRTFTSRKE